MLASGLLVPGSRPSVLTIYDNNQRRYVGLATYNFAAAAHGVDFFQNGMVGYLPAGVYYSGPTSTSFSGPASGQWQSYIETAFAESWVDDKPTYGSDGMSVNVSAHSTGLVPVGLGSYSISYTPDACGDMADIAQGDADGVLASLSAGAHAGVQSGAIRQELDDAVLRFDDVFSERYAGHPMRTNDDITDFYHNNVEGRTIPEYYWGQTGFKKIYMETKPGTETIVDDQPTDQTHHFAAMFSGGINGARWATTAHDMFDNAGDRRLTRAAFTLGVQLRHNPYDTLRHIGKIIRDTICDPGTRGRNLGGMPSGAGDS